MQLRKYNGCFFISVILLLASGALEATIVGSDSNTQAAKAFFTFPQGQANNRLATYGFASGGFALATAATSAIFDSVYPIAGPLDLNGGTLVLDRDLLCSNITTLQGLGYIIGQGHIFSLSQNSTSLPNDAVWFQDTSLIFNNDITISSAITFTGINYIQGNGHVLTLGNNSAIKVDGTLVLQNVILNGVASNNVRCLDDFSLIILDNVKWIQKSDAVFLLGALQFRNDVLFTGTNTFAYQTLKTSLVTANASLILDHGFTFSYDAVRLASKTLLQFTDSTAALIMNGATLYTTGTGLNLTRGSLLISGDSVFASDVQQTGTTITLDNGITLGDGVLSVSDMATDITTGARLLLSKGSLNYKNINSSSWLMENSLSTLNMGNSTTLRLYQNLNLGLGALLANPNVVISKATGVNLAGSISAVGNLTFAQL